MRRRIGWNVLWATVIVMLLLFLGIPFIPQRPSQYELTVASKVEALGGQATIYFGDVRLIVLSGTQVTNDDLEDLSRLPSLESLDLRNTRIGDPGLAHLSELSILGSLNLRDTRIGDAGLAHLSELETLRALWLGNTEVTDEGVRYLAKLKNLTYLDITGTAITPVGLDELGRSLPSCRVTSSIEPGD